MKEAITIESLNEGALLEVANEYLVRAYDDLCEREEFTDKRRIMIAVELHKNSDGSVDIKTSVSLKLPDKYPKMSDIKKLRLHKLDDQLFPVIAGDPIIQHKKFAGQR